METIVNYKGVEMLVEFDYQPPEPMVMYYPDGSGYPGCDAHINITNIEIEDQDAWELIEAILNGIEEIEELIWEAMADED